jgi:microcystin-dependent protein
MPAPIPIDIVAGALPLGLKGNLQQIFNGFVEAMSATIDATFLTGVVTPAGGTAPTSDVGPWANGNEWWFWDPSTGQYQPSDQGTPVGTVVIWGGQGAPNNWLLCDGRAVARTSYSRLFQAIGETWGAGDGATTFNLPPGNCFFINAPGFVAATQVPITAGFTGQGVNSRGGGQTYTLTTDNMPAMQVIAPAYGAEGASCGFNLVAGGAPGQGPCGNAAWSVRDGNGLPVGTVILPTSIMPPFCAANFVIKYQ